MIKYADIKKYDVANAPYVNCSIYFSGCNFHCKGCFNKCAQDFNYGEEYTKEVEDEFIQHINNPNIRGVCLLGGEVFQQDLNVILLLVKRIKSEVNKPIWVWSGYLWDELIKDSRKLDILRYLDVLVDGRFEEDKKDLSLMYRGSSNQRIICVQESLKQGKVIEYKFR